MRILSLNAWGGRLFDDLIDYLPRTEADVFCLQEITRTPDAGRQWLSYRDEGGDLPQRANLFDELRAALPGHEAFFCSAARGDLFDGETAVLSEWGLATFVRRGVPVIGQTQRFVHGDFPPHGFGGRPRPRNAHAVRLFDEAARRTVTVAHMHGLRDPAGKGDTPARVRQAAAFARVIEDCRGASDAVVACGDFNVLPQSATFASLADVGLADLVAAYGFDDTRTSHYKKSPRYADYMLVGAGVEVKRFEVVATPEVSDHRALWLEI